MNTSILWDHEDPVADLGIDVPAWIRQDIDGSTIAAIIQGGCASGAYMPAVTYYTARETMAEHGDDVLEYLDSMGVAESLNPDHLLSGTFSHLCVVLLSAAVEAWASEVGSEVVDALESDEEDDEDPTLDLGSVDYPDGSEG